MPPSRLRRVAEYGFAMGVSGAALLLRLWLIALVGPGLALYITFYPAVMLAATLWGGGPGLLATAVSALLAAYWVLPPVGQFAITSRVDAVGLAIFVLLGGGMSLVAALYHRARVRAATYATRLQAEEGLRASEERYRSLFEHMLNGFAYCRMVVEQDRPPDFIYLAVNRAFETLTGLQDVVGKRASEVIPGIQATDPELFEIYGRVARTGVPERFERYVQALEMWFAVAVYCPSPDHFVVVFDVVTERKRAEAALQQAHATLEQRVQARTAELARAVAIREHQAEQLRVLAAELTRAEQRERRRLAEVLHDGLQQLLVAARVRAHMLGRSNDQEVRDGCQEMVALLEEALAESRTLTGELSPPTLQRGGLLPALEWLTRWMGEKHHLTVSLRPPRAPLPHLAEDLSVLLYQAVRELLLNTVKYAQVLAAEVTLTHQEHSLTLTVADAGVGFDPTRLRVAGGVEGGFGLLGIRERLELLGGRLEIESRAGRGSRFRLVAPLDRVGRADPAPHAAAEAVAVSADIPPDRRTRVLLVDDHALVRRGFATLLAGEPDLEVVGEAANGMQAIELTRKVAPDVILMDIGMPVMNGIEATRAIHAEFPAARVIGLSVLDATEQSDAMLAAGAVTHLSKSDSAEALLAAIRGGRTPMT